jgi:serine/threonine protein kinase
MAEKLRKPEEEIFYQALEKTPDQRKAYLAKVCGDNRKLYNRIEALLKANELEDNFLQSPMLDSNLTLDTTANLEEPGMIIGRYKLLEKIGEGGMAVVYMAEQTEPIRRKVALKIIKLGMDTKSVIARFEAERQALAMMDHPNIARVLDAGATETGRPYFVMELVTGVSITEYCDKNNLNTKERLTLFIQVCNAVQHAHQKGIIHRDIKPSNVMVTRQEGQPVPKVIDFGIAKAINQKLTEKTLFTRYAHIIGTPAYMSPEQADLGDLDVDTRSDIYSLGVLLYELLTGTTPFSEEELRKVGYLEMQRVIREQQPPKPSTKLSTLGETLTYIAKYRGCTPDLLTKAISGDLDWIVMKTLEKARDRRYGTISALVMDIQRNLNDEPVLARAPSIIYRLRKFLRRHRSRAIASIVVFILVVALVVVLMIWNHNQRRLNTELYLQQRNALYRATHSFKGGYLARALIDVKPILNSKDVGSEARFLYDQIVAKARDSVDYYNSKIEANPKDADSYYRRAKSFQCLDQRESANSDMQKYSTLMSQEWSSDFTIDTVTNLGPAINTTAFETIAGISNDGLSFYFLRIFEGHRKELWASTRASNDSPWKTATYLGSLKNISLTGASVKSLPGVTTADGLEAYYYADLPGGYGWTDIYFMKRETTDDIWGPFTNLGGVVNSAYQESFPCVSPNGLELFFSGREEELARPGGCGESDLWITRRATRSDPWGEPVNMGPVINSAYLDARPSISPDGLLLFFDSERPGGFGHFDLWVTRRSTIDTPWTEPVNLGPFINTPSTEECARISADGSMLYWDSGRLGSYGDNDIWQANVIGLSSTFDPNNGANSTNQMHQDDNLGKEVNP